MLFVTKMASLGPKKVGADQVLDPEFLVSSTVSSFSIDRYSSQQSFKCNTYGVKNVAQLTMQFCLVSSLATIQGG